MRPTTKAISTNSPSVFRLLPPSSASGNNDHQKNVKLSRPQTANEIHKLQ